MIALLAPLAAPASARAVDRYWTGAQPLPWWDDPLNWSPSGQPQHGDRALLLQSDATNRVVWYYNSAHPAAVLPELRIDATGTGSIELQINAYNYPLNVTDEYIGDSGKGYMYQNTGTNTANFLYLAYGAGSQGRYTLAENGLLTTSASLIGYAGSGTFQQSGGTHNANDTLHVGADYGGAGYYSLGGGTLNAGQLWLGMFAGNAGTFAQTGGVHNARTVTVGGLDGVGTYNLSDGTLNVTDWTGIWIGYSLGGAGTFIQSGGLLHVSSAARIFYVGANSDSPGYYLMSGGTLAIDAGSLSVNSSAGHVDQSGGVITTPELLVNGTYQLRGNGMLNVSGDAWVAKGGGMGVTGTFTQLGGRHDVSGNLYLAEAGVSGSVPADSAFYQLQGGTLTVSGSEYVGQWGNGTVQHGAGVNSANYLSIGYGSTARGTYVLEGTGHLSSGTTYVGYGGTGTFSHGQGLHETSWLMVAYNPNSRGTYTLDGGTLQAGGEVISDDAGAVGTFVHNGGTNHVLNDLYLAGYSTLSLGRYQLNGGTLLVDRQAQVGLVGAGTFTQSGGLHAVSSTLGINSNAAGASSYLKTGGTLAAGHIINAGRFDHALGTLAVSGGMINTGTASIGGTQRWATGATYVNDGAGVSTFNTDAGTPAARTLSVHVDHGTVTFNATQHLAGLYVDAGANAGLSAGSHSVLVTEDYSAAGRLDLADNAMIVDYTVGSPIVSIRADIVTGYAGGLWSGNGLTSTMSGPSHYGLGYAPSTALFSSFPATFWGESVDSTAVIVRCTRYGDANLDGVVNLADFNRLAANFGQSHAWWWDRGDFNYDGQVNLTDFNLMAGNFGLSAGPDGVVDPSDWAALAAVVPEPGAFGCLLLSAAALARRRRE